MKATSLSRLDLRAQVIFDLDLRELHLRNTALRIFAADLLISANRA